MTTGRPTKLTQVLRTEDDGQRVTVADHIIQVIGAGNYIEAAAASAGIDKVTIYDWLRKGAQLSTDYEQDRIKAPRKDSRDAALIAFSHAVAKAEAEWEIAANVTLERLGRPRAVEETRTTVERDANGEQVTKVMTLRKTEEADSATIRWRLERKMPTKYGRQILEVSGPEGGPIPVDVKAQLREAMEAMADRLAANTPPTEEPDSV